MRAPVQRNFCVFDSIHNPFCPPQASQCQGSKESRPLGAREERLGAAAATVDVDSSRHIVIAELRRTSASDPRRHKVLLELMRDVIHHVADEETTLLPQAEILMSKARLSELGSQMTMRGMELIAPKAGKLAKSHALGLSGSTTAMVVGLASALFAMRQLVKKPDGEAANPKTWANASSTPHAG